MKSRGCLFWLGVSFLGILLVFAVFGPSIRYSPIDPAGKPNDLPSAKFWLGTDEQGRDIFARLAYGARTSLTVGFAVQILALAIGITVGMLGIFAPKWIRLPLLRLTDTMFAFPDILLAILIIGVFPIQGAFLGRFNPGLVAVIVSLAVTSWPAVVRLVVTQVATLKDREFVVASRALGASTFYLIAKHILPHLWGVLLAVSMVDLAGTILAESALSFLGIGVQAPDPSWGSMINTARSDMNSNPQLLIWPCLALSATIFALNFVGDGLRAALDPRNR